MTIAEVANQLSGRVRSTTHSPRWGSGVQGSDRTVAFGDKMASTCIVVATVEVW